MSNAGPFRPGVTAVFDELEDEDGLHERRAVPRCLLGWTTIASATDYHHSHPADSLQLLGLTRENASALRPPAKPAVSPVKPWKAETHATSRRRPRSAASRSARSPSRSVHRPESRSSPRLRTRPPLGLRPDPRPHRHRTAYVILQVRRRAAPVRLEQAISAVPRDGHRLGAGAIASAVPPSDRVGRATQRAKFREDAGELGQAVAGEPELVLPAGLVGVERKLKCWEDPHSKH